MENERKKIENNSLEINFATNTLGTHILTKTLMPLVAKSEKPRIVWKLLYFTIFFIKNLIYIYNSLSFRLVVC
jgi:hypothetical protein